MTLVNLKELLKLYIDDKKKILVVNVIYATIISTKYMKLVVSKKCIWISSEMLC